MSDRRRWTALALLLVFSGLVLGYLWWGKFHYYHRPLLIAVDLAALLIVVCSHYAFGDSRHELGLRLDNLKKALAAFGMLSVSFVAVIGAGAWWLLPAATDAVLPAFPWVYVVWAGVQQYVLQNFIRLRAAQLLQSPWAVALAAAALFAVFHLPNLALALLTFAAGIGWCRLYTRHPNLLAAWASQAFVGCLLIFLLKDAALDQMSVGRTGFRYEAYGGGVLVAGGRDASGAPFVATLPAHDIGVEARLQIRTLQGEVLHEISVFPGRGFSGQLSAGDAGFGAGDEIVVAPGPGGGNPASAVVFSPQGRQLARFEAPELSNGYGAWVEAGCGQVVVAAGPAPGQQLRVRTYTDGSPPGPILRLDTTGFVNGGRARRLCHPEHDGYLVWPAPMAVNPADFLVLPANWRGEPAGGRRRDGLTDLTYGLQLAVVRAADGRLRVAVAPGPLRGYPALIRLLDLEGRALGGFRLADATCGAHVAALDVDSDGIDELLVSEGVGCRSRVWISTQQGEVLYQWESSP